MGETPTDAGQLQRSDEHSDVVKKCDDPAEGESTGPDPKHRGRPGFVRHWPATRRDDARKNPGRQLPDDQGANQAANNGGGTRTRDLLVMSQPSYHCSTPLDL